jgi:hypothetical protein
MNVFRKGCRFYELIVLGGIIALDDKLGLCAGLFTIRLIFLVFLESNDINESTVSEHGRETEGSASFLVRIKPLYCRLVFTLVVKF